jgi:4-hydroxybenzoate polyprenyltransferase
MKLKFALKYILDLLLYSNAFIAICSACFVLQTYLQLGQEIRIDALVIFSASATLFTYLLIREISLRSMMSNHGSMRIDWLGKHRSLIYLLLIMSAIGLGVSFFWLTPSVKIALVLPGVISLLYGLPFIKIGERLVRIRDIWIIKIFLISFVWAYLASILPAAQFEIEIVSNEVALLFLSKFAFIFAITIPFDIRDLEYDKMYKVKTLPMLTGNRIAIQISLVLLFIFELLNFLFYQVSTSNIANAGTFVTPMLITGILTAFLILFSKKQTHEYYFLGLIDGMIICQFLLLILFKSMV